MRYHGLFFFTKQVSWERSGRCFQERGKRKGLECRQGERGCSWKVGEESITESSWLWELLPSFTWHIKKMLYINCIIWIHDESKSSEEDLSPCLRWCEAEWIYDHEARQCSKAVTWLTVQPCYHLRCEEAEAQEVWLNSCHSASENSGTWHVGWQLDFAGSSAESRGHSLGLVGAFPRVQLPLFGLPLVLRISFQLNCLDLFFF